MRIPFGATSLVLSATLASGATMPCISGSDDGTLTIQRSGEQAPREGSPKNFTGAVRVDPTLKEMPPSRLSGGLVTFEPGARTAWHTDPFGQTLIVTAGAGRVQQWDGPMQEIRPGDVVRIPPGVKHWHGALPTVGVNHIALSEVIDGKVVD